MATTATATTMATMLMTEAKGGEEECNKFNKPT